MPLFYLVFASNTKLMKFEYIFRVLRLEIKI